MIHTFSGFDSTKNVVKRSEHIAIPHIFLIKNRLKVQFRSKSGNDKLE